MSFRCIAQWLDSQILYQVATPPYFKCLPGTMLNCYNIIIDCIPQVALHIPMTISKGCYKI